MGQTSVELVRDSVSIFDQRITTLKLVYPRIIHDEFLTHRAFSRNASSNRAIPLERILADLRDNYYIPNVFDQEKRGMSSDTPLPETLQKQAESLWIEGIEKTIETCKSLEGLGIHKQFINYLLLPYQYITVLVTATDWENFFNLRDSPEAHPEMRKLARRIREVMNVSTPEIIEYGWHIPFCGSQILTCPSNLVESVAYCARISYNAKKKFTLEQNLDLARRLYKNKHMSPFEHIAKPVFGRDRYANFTGWRSLRFFIDTNWHNSDVNSTILQLEMGDEDEDTTRNED